jgi:HlyD family secretion protein
VRIDGETRSITGTVRWVSADANFTPYFALTEHDRSRVSYLAEIDVPDASSLPSGIPLEVDFPASILTTD